MFQFTQPKRAATRVLCQHSGGRAGFNSRSPSGLRREVRRKTALRDIVSIHAAQAGCDGCCKDTTKKEILSKDKSRKSLSVIILDEEDKAIGLELTDNQALRNSNKIMFT